MHIRYLIQFIQPDVLQRYSRNIFLIKLPGMSLSDRTVRREWFDKTWGKSRVILMKKVIVVLISFLIVGLVVFTLLKNKAEIAEKAKIVPISSYPVSVVEVARETLVESLSQVGVITANNDLALVSEHQGKVIEVMVKEGSRVAVGSPIVRLDDLLSQASLMSAQTSYEKAKKDWERHITLHKDGLVSETDLESKRLDFKEAEADYITARRQFHNSIITSPISGVVTARPVDLGSMVNPGTVVANILDTSKFKVKVNVPEQNAFKLKVGDRVTVETDVYPGVQLSGSIDFISDKADADHTYPVQVIIPGNKQYPLKSGMYGTVTFKQSPRQELVIPRTALHGSVKEPQVFVVEGDQVKLRDIVIGAEINTKLPILRGLNEGEKVVYNGQENLNDGSKIYVVE